VSDTARSDIEGLYRQHRVRLVRLVERELHERQDAEDVVQTAFLDAQRALQRGTIPHNPSAWLAAIALNAARRLSRRHLNVDALEEYAAQEASQLPEIKAALADLSKNEQAAVLYRDLLGLSYAEMAEQMDTTVAAVGMLLHRARSRLRGVLGSTVVGVGLARLLRGSAWQGTAAKAAGVVVLAGGLGTAGVVAGRHAARATAPPTAASTIAASQGRREAGRLSNTAVARSRANREELRLSPDRVRTEQRPSGAVQKSATAPTTLQAPSSSPVLSEAPPVVPDASPTPRPALSVAASPTPSAALSVTTPSIPAPPLPAPPLPTNGTITAPSATTTLQTPIATLSVSVP
jgi:RNA polymerase sigma-70 factor, ECF subfamily